jgi:hemerythrin superfamily protein
MNQQRGDVVTVLERQHADVRDMFASLRAEPDAESFAAVVRLLTAHETAEELVVYPVVRADVPDGAALADARLAEERAAKQQLAELESIGVGGAAFPELFGRFADDVLGHATNEERQVFPLLRQELSEQRRFEMAAELAIAESTAPTHAHRHAPTSAIGNLVIGPFVSIVDRLRDAFRARRAS